MIAYKANWQWRLRCLMFLFLLFAKGIYADQGGVPFWISGQYGSFAALPKNPGWSLPSILYYSDGDGELAQSFGRIKTIAVGMQPTYAPDFKIFGGQLALAIGYGVGSNETEGRSLPSFTGKPFDLSHSDMGGTDLYPLARIAWSQGFHNEMFYITGDIPIASYRFSERIANIGLGHSAVDLGGGYTFFNEKTGIEYSAVAGVTYNSENPHTHYQNGVDSHLDYEFSKFFTKQFQLGLAGYVYYQLTGDRGANAIVGSFISKIAAIGPELGYLFKVGQQENNWYANIRGYYEFWAENRVRGYEIFGTLNIPLS